MSRLTKRGAEAVLRDLATRDLKRLALLGPSGMAGRILSQVKAEHRAAVQDDKQLVKDVRDRGGVCFPGGMTAGEWSDRLPRALHGRKRRCVPADELAQELYDRGRIADPSQDAVLDRLSGAYVRARTSASVPEPKELMKEARRLLGAEVRRTVKEVVRSASESCEAACPQPLEASLSGARKPRLGSSGGASYAVGQRVWFKGNEVTVVSEPFVMHGGLFQKAVTDQGRTIIVAAPSQARANAARSRKEWSEQQVDFRKLRKRR